MFTPLNPILELIIIINVIPWLIKLFIVSKIWVNIKKTLAGRKGERFMSKTVKKVKKRKDLWTKNVYLNEFGGGEIDGILFKGKTAFVFESKNIKGKVRGYFGDQDWMFGKKHYYNPAKQNETHIKKLQSWAERQNIEIKNFVNVVFLPFKTKGEVSISKVGKPSDIFVVRNKKELKRLIKRYSYEKIDNRVLKKKFKENKSNNKKRKKNYIKKLKKQYS